MCKFRCSIFAHRFYTMLQRIQSVFLLLAAVCALLTWFFPVETLHLAGGPIFFRPNGIFQADGTEVEYAELPIPFHVLHTIIGVVMLVCVFLYGNRPRQMRIVRAAWLMALAAGVLQFVSSNSLHAFMADEGDFTSSYGVSFFLPLGVILFALLAERAIRKDENLVRSADRLR